MNPWDGEGGLGPLTKALGEGSVPRAIALARQDVRSQQIKSVDALIGHGGAEAEPVGAARLHLPDAVFQVPGVRTVHNCKQTTEQHPKITGSKGWGRKMWGSPKKKSRKKGGKSKILCCDLRVFFSPPVRFLRVRVEKFVVKRGEKWSPGNPAGCHPAAGAGSPAPNWDFDYPGGNN